MKLDEIKDIALDLMKKHGLDKWSFEWGTREDMLSNNTGADTYGKSNYSNRTITLSKELTKFEQDKNRVINTILHEVAHAIDYEKRGKSNHDEVWQDIAKSIGCNADEITDNKTLKLDKVYKWKATCDFCGTNYHSRLEPENKRSCSKCGGETYNDKYQLTYKENPNLIKDYSKFVKENFGK
jgi:predicted SprT family Zn-dependent metalloprotease